MGKKYSKQHKYNVGEVVSTKHHKLLILEQIRVGKNNIKGYKYKCLNCDNEANITEGNLTQGKGCNSCCYITWQKNHGKQQSRIRKVTTRNKNSALSIYEADKEFAKLFANEEDAKNNVRYSTEWADFKCPNCGYVKSHKICSVYSYGLSCEMCSDGISIGEKFISNLLLQLNVQNKTHMRGFKWSKNIITDNKKLCGNKEYDFYLPDYDIIIEVHGLQHYTNGCFETLNNSKVKTFNEEVENDKIKRELALQNGIKSENYIVLDFRYTDFSWFEKTIKESKLASIFNIDKIDLKECYKKSLSSMIIESCKLYNLGYSVNEIAEQFNVSKDAVRKWLKKGTKINLCAFDGKFNAKNGNSTRIYNTISCKEYNSISEASRELNLSRRVLSNMVNDPYNNDWVKIK